MGASGLCMKISRGAIKKREKAPLLVSCAVVPQHINNIIFRIISATTEILNLKFSPESHLFLVFITCFALFICLKAIILKCKGAKIANAIIS